MLAWYRLPSRVMSVRPSLVSLAVVRTASRPNLFHAADRYLGYGYLWSRAVSLWKPEKGRCQRMKDVLFGHFVPSTPWSGL